MGKTTCAAAAALVAAEGGRRVAVISTDPAHSLGDAVGQRLGAAPRRVSTRGGTLEAVELDADRALARWLARRRPMLRTIAERGTYLDDEDLERLLRLSFPGVDELMALVELARLADRGRWELVVVDTAPTGHALRMLDMPQTLRRIASVLDAMYAKHRFLADSLGRGHRPGAPDRLIEELDADGRRLTELLRAPDRCRFTWLMLPERLSLEETRDGVAALATAGIAVSELVVNRLTPAPADPCALCEGRRLEEGRVLAETRRAFPALPLRALPALEREPRGAPALRAVGRLLHSRAARGQRAVAISMPLLDFERGGETPPRMPPGSRGVRRRLESNALGQPGAVASWLERVAPEGVRLLVFAGKGGVGKTTCAAAAAVALARTRERYRRAVEETFDSLLRGSRFDVAYDREALHGLMDLAPPGLDELFAVLSVIEALLEREPPYDVVVLDTAPTGHALRLLEMPATALAWVHALLAILLKYREVVGLGEVAAELVATARRLRELSALLGDAGRARVVAVTRAAELPQRETGRLLARLRWLRLDVPAVLVNALTGGACRRCRRVHRAERRTMAVPGCGARLRRRPWGMISTPALASPPRGVAELERWVRTWVLEG